MADGVRNDDTNVPDTGQHDSDLPTPGTPDVNTVTTSQESLSTPARSIEDLYNPPRNLAYMRQRLFEINGKIELQVEEFERYWPYVDNVWVRQHKAGTSKKGKVFTDYYACRLQRPTYTPKAVDTPRPEGQPTRKKQIREGGTCQMRLKTIRYEGGYRSYTIVRVGDEMHHTHDLEHIDKIKRTSVLMDIARSEVMKGFMPASVFTVMNENQPNLVAAGGRYLSRNDVRNASQNWRQQHREELRVHTGYKYDHGNGIIRREFPLPACHGDSEMRNIDPALNESFQVPSEVLRFPHTSCGFLAPYLPPQSDSLTNDGLPYVTLTYATSMDSSLTLAPGMQTPISGPESKAMTHYLRSKHDAILIGVGTAVADDPRLNCRLEGVGGFGGLGWEGQPRPVIVDPRARWLISPESSILKAVQNGKGKAPWVIMTPGFNIDPIRIETLTYYGGKYLGLRDFDKRWRLKWEAILKALAAEGVKSVMIEGGGMTINELLQLENAKFIGSLIVTIAPTYHGKGGVGVHPAPKHDLTGRPQPALRFQDVKWQPLGQDVVMCGRPVGVKEPSYQIPNPTGVPHTSGGSAH